MTDAEAPAPDLLHEPDRAALRAAGLDPQRSRAIGDALRRLVGRRVLPGIALRLVRRGVALDYRVGHHDLAQRRLLAGDTLWRLYSMTKPMTAALLFTLWQEGHWQLDDPVERFVPELADRRVCRPDRVAPGPAARRSILMRDLLLHTSGLSYGLEVTPASQHPLDAEYTRLPVIDFTQSLDVMASRLQRLPLIEHPGRRYVYSVAIDVLGLVAQRIAGKPLDQLFRERLFEPLGMHDAAFHVAGPRAGRIAGDVRHDASGELVPADAAWSPVMVPDLTRAPVFVSGGGGVACTLDDAARFLRCVAGGGTLDGVRLLAPRTLRRMLAPALHPPAFPTPGYALTLAGITRLTDPVLGQCLAPPGLLFTGGAGGAFGLVDPANDLLVVAMLQTLAWNEPVHGPPPAYALEAPIYHALDT